jgi:hypothetical protein
MRLRVEIRFRKLAIDPNPAEATRKAGGTGRHLRVPETTLEILYAVNEVARRIDLLSLRALGETPHA